MVSELVIDNEYEWTHPDGTIDRVVVRGKPLILPKDIPNKAPGDEYPAGFPKCVPSCEVEVLSMGRLEFAPVAELRLAD